MSFQDNYDKGIAGDSTSPNLYEDTFPVHGPRPCDKCGIHPIARRRRFLYPFHRLSLFLAGAALAIITLALSVRSFRSSRIFHGLAGSSNLNNYFSLAEYTVSWQLKGDGGSGPSTIEAAELWEQILDTAGIVVLPHAWAKQHNLPPSKPHPERPDHGVYQVSVWHSLHCLYRIRNRIASHVPIDEVPRDDAHTLHCLDYIRQQLMCHADTSLQDALSNRKVHNQCRDFGGIQSWVRDRGWPGFGDYVTSLAAGGNSSTTAGSG